jgi:hypothetical protein
MPDEDRKRHWPEWWVPPQPVPDRVEGAHVKRMMEWMDSMVQWGKNVRDDIIRLESSTGIGLGDPGDPPPPPWRDDEEEEPG